MSQFTWESEALEEPLSEPELELEREPEPEHAQPEPQRQRSEPAAEPGTLAMSVDDFSALEDRILRAVHLVKRERLASAAAEERAAHAEAQLREQTPQVEHLQKEVDALRAERGHVRQRVERLLAQLDALEL